MIRMHDPFMTIKSNITYFELSNLRYHAGRCRMLRNDFTKQPRMAIAM